MVEVETLTSSCSVAAVVIDAQQKVSRGPSVCPPTTVFSRSEPLPYRELGGSLEDISVDGQLLLEK